MTLAIIDAGLRGLRQNAANRLANVQRIGLLILAHAAEHGDCSRAAPLMRILPTSERTQLRRWFDTYSPISVRVGKTAADDRASLRKQGDKKHATWNIDGATANPWHTMAKDEKEQEILNLEAFSGKVASSLAKLLKSIDKSVSEADREAAKAIVNAASLALADKRKAQNTADDAAHGFAPRPRRVANG